MISQELRLKTIAVCSELLLEAMDDGRKLNPNGELLKSLLEKQVEVVYSHKEIRNNKSYQETKNRVLFNINAHFKLPKK
jgi:hypothetical protein